VIHVEHKHPYQAIIDTAAAKACDLIVMALARPPRRRRARSRQRDAQDGYALQDSGAGRSMSLRRDAPGSHYRRTLLTDRQVFSTTFLAA
jgi:hypothetical protein